VPTKCFTPAEVYSRIVWICPGSDAGAVEQSLGFGSRECNPFASDPGFPVGGYVRAHGIDHVVSELLSRKGFTQTLAEMLEKKWGEPR